MMKNRKIYYGWWVLAGCTAMNIFTLALNVTCASLYIKPVSEALGVSRGAFSLQSTIVALAMMITALFMGKLISKFNIRVLVSACTASVGILSILLSFATNIIHFYIIGVFIGISLCGCTVLPVYVMITNWFYKKRGLALSIATIGTSVGGVVFNPLVNYFITHFGWQKSYLFVGIIVIVAVLPFTMFVIRKNPAEKGLLPYGIEEGGINNTKSKAMDRGMELKEVKKMPIFYVFLFGIVCVTIVGNGAMVQIPAYLCDIGYSSTFAASVASVYLAVGILGKFIFGQISDKKGEKFASIYGCSVFALSFACIIFAKSIPMLALMVIFYGLGNAINSMIAPLLTAKIFGSKDYANIYGIVSAVTKLGGAIGIPAIAMIYDITGGYTLAWILCVILLIISIAIFIYSFNYGKEKEIKSRGEYSYEG